MISKNKIAYLKSLADRKTRHELGRFLVEGKKAILEVINSDFRIVEGFLVHDFLNPLQKNFPCELISETELKKITSLTSNRDGVVVVEMPENNFFENRSKFSLVLDGINDPGNLGTIIRIADWYGISEIIASPDTVDIYNSKTLMATMGSFTRVRVIYTDLVQFLSEQKGQKIYGALLAGKNLHTTNLLPEGFLIIGNEANGIRPNIQKFITEKITIPRFGGAESLNAWVATGIIVDRIMGK